MAGKKKPGKKRKTPTVHEATTSPYGMTISSSEFKTRCLELMDRVQQTRKEITVTRYGKPIAKLVPFPQEHQGIVGSMKGTVLWYGDIVSPTGIADDFEAMKDD
jgi:prevent-host-death family protein